MILLQATVAFQSADVNNANKIKQALTDRRSLTWPFTHDGRKGTSNNH